MRASIDDPIAGMELVASFYETDKAVFGRCDDSGGWVGDVFRIEAKELFVEYALQCEEKQKVASVIVKTMKSNDYGARDTLIECAGQCLSEESVRSMIAAIQKRADKEKDEDDRRSQLYLIQSVARQIKDAELFEKTCLACWGEQTTASIIDIAQVYFESGEVQTAHSWLKKIAAGERFMEAEKEALLVEIYRQEGKTEKLTELLEHKFRTRYSIRTFEQLLDVIGMDKREEVISGAIEAIWAGSTFRISDALFLTGLEEYDAAERYLLKFGDQLQGEFYEHLLSLVKVMEEERSYLAASLIYRSLLMAILERGYAKAYTYGARYLKKLDKLGPSVADWDRFDNHDTFKAYLREKHGLKTRFWSKYEG